MVCFSGKQFSCRHRLHCGKPTKQAQIVNFFFRCCCCPSNRRQTIQFSTRTCFPPNFVSVYVQIGSFTAINWAIISLRGHKRGRRLSKETCKMKLYVRETHARLHSVSRVDGFSFRVPVSVVGFSCSTYHPPEKYAKFVASNAEDIMMGRVEYLELCFFASFFMNMY